ncbi:unnamed protein product [Pedinophyceae sp. YPF-701]|nr:unnamed protein product [Pedinophyceae sp. YPF-701]
MPPSLQLRHISSRFSVDWDFPGLTTKDAVHTANLNRDARCSLFVQPPSQPARSLARVTLVGSVAPVEHDRYEELAEMHLAVHGPGIGVDMMQPDDLFYRLEVDEVFYVGGMGSDGSAQVLPGADFAAAVPDGLYSSAEELVATWNERRADEVARIAAAAAKVPLSKLDWAELMWVDTNGIFLHLSKGDGVETVRVDFDRPAIDDRDARSKLTMLAQLAWEAENMDYRSMLPELLDNSANTN